MSLPIVRFFLISTGIVYLGLGLSFIFATSTMVSKLPFMITAPAGTTEIRAVYGGLELALGIVFIYAGALNRSLDFAVFTMLATFIGLATIRGVGILIDGSQDSFTMKLWYVESFGVLYSSLSWVLLKLNEPGSSLSFLGGE
ncbi:MAG: DUF4345 family protein [SAR324 cluster bacterium]|nr:DUF4345 family protein [SAR324 cluster bacterium]